jgi:uncharacterized membrane protein
MHLSELHYLPLTPSFFSILVALFVFLVVLIQVGALRYAYARIGVSSRTALLLLMGSLIGSYINIPVAHLGAASCYRPGGHFSRHALRGAGSG